jgi:hypothetical protein
VSSTPELGPVIVSVPARTDYLHLLRLNAAGVAASAFDVDTVEDLKIAIEELAARLIDIDGDDEIQVTFEFDADGLIVVGARATPRQHDLEIDEFLPTILDAVVDDYDLEVVGGQATFRFAKRFRDLD